MQGIVLGIPHNRPARYKKLDLRTKRKIVSSRKKRGDVSKVAALAGFSVPYVSQVLNSVYTNERIINVAYNIARFRKS